MTAADSDQGKIKEKCSIFWLIINKPQPNLHAGDTWLGPEGVPLAWSWVIYTQHQYMGVMQNMANKLD